MANTVIGVYDNFAQAQSALKQLLASGFSSLDVRLQPSEDTAAARESVLRSVNVASSSTGNPAETGTLRNFFHNLFGGDAHTADQHPADRYAEAVRRGSFVLTADAVTEQQRDTASAIMEQFQPIDVDQRAAHWQAAGWQRHDETAAPFSDDELTAERNRYGASASNTGTGTGTRTGAVAGTMEQAAIPIIEEELKVGKREVQRGGVRVVQRVIETPVQESVNLREEHVTIERRAVDAPATAADIDAMRDETIELREIGEEAVVAKTARVVEEVVIGKEVTEKEAPISDTVRRTDVEVQQLGTTDAVSGLSSGTTTGGGVGYAGSGIGSTQTGDAAYRSYWQSAYGATGASYDDYAPAYQYGESLNQDQRYTNHDWTTSEPAIRQQWESTHPHGAWDKVKDAVRYGWNKVTH